MKGCHTSFKTPNYFCCGCNYPYIYCQYSEVHHILYNLTNAVNKMQQDYRIKCTKKYLNGISLTDFLKSLFIPMRYKTNTAFFSIWISLKITQSKSVFLRFFFLQNFHYWYNCSWNMSKYTFRLRTSNKIFQHVIFYVHLQYAFSKTWDKWL